MMIENLQPYQITLLTIMGTVFLIFLVLLIVPIIYYIKRKFDFLKLLLKNKHSTYQEVLEEYNLINSKEVTDNAKKGIFEILKILLHRK